MGNPLTILGVDAAGVQGSFTRFVLPFSYDARRLSGDDHRSSLIWERRTDDDLERRRYLTPETAAVLHDRALWLELAAEFPFTAETGPKKAAGGRETRSFKRLRPKLVLFEWPAEPQNGDAAPSGDRDLLKTGFLLLDIAVADSSTTLDDLLFFNEMFRYWLSPWVGHDTKSGYLGVVKDYLAKAPECNAEGLTNDGHLRRWEALLRLPLELGSSKGSTRYWLVSPTSIETTREWVRSGKAIEEPKAEARPAEVNGLGWVVYADNRAFVWTCGVMGSGDGEGAGAGSLSQRFGRDVRAPHLFGHWLRLVNIDPPADTPEGSHSIVSRFERDWIKAATYLRWAHEGSWYGYSQHAGAAILPPKEDPPLWKHFRDIYFDQVLLLLYLRVSTFRFSQRLSEISAQARQKKRQDQQAFHEEFQKLRWAFALLTNLYRFPLISNQQQGIEMYTLARRQLDVDELFEEVEQEIRASEEYLSSRVNLRHAKTAAGLQVVATLAIPVGIALATAQVVPDAWKWTASIGLGAVSLMATIVLSARTDDVMGWMDWR